MRSSTACGRYNPDESQSGAGGELPLAPVYSDSSRRIDATPNSVTFRTKKMNASIRQADALIPSNGVGGVNLMQRFTTCVRPYRRTVDVLTGEPLSAENHRF